MQEKIIFTALELNRGPRVTIQLSNQQIGLFLNGHGNTFSYERSPKLFGLFEKCKFSSKNYCFMTIFGGQLWEKLSHFFEHFITLNG